MKNTKYYSRKFEEKCVDNREEKGEKRARDNNKPNKNMIKWYFIKLLPVFIWILSEKLDAANGDAVAVDAINDEDVQVKFISQQF